MVKLFQSVITDRCIVLLFRFDASTRRDFWYVQLSSRRAKALASNRRLLKSSVRIKNCSSVKATPEKVCEIKHTFTYRQALGASDIIGFVDAVDHFYRPTMPSSIFHMLNQSMQSKP